MSHKTSLPQSRTVIKRRVSAVLQLKSVTKRFGETTAVDQVSLEIPTGQMVGIIGRSGAGKSTLLRLINLLSNASGGELVFEGRDVLKLRGRERRQWMRECAMIFQQFNLVPRLSVLNNVLLGRLNYHNAFTSLLGLWSEEEKIAAIQNLERLDMVQTVLKRADELSGGQQQRVAIARALMQNPKIMLADEPIASLDPHNAKIVMQTLRDINQRDGLTVICNLHTLDTARAFCDRIIGMAQGRVVFDGSADELTMEAAQEIYGVDGIKEALDESITSTDLGTKFPQSTASTPAPVAASAVG